MQEASDRAASATRTLHSIGGVVACQFAPHAPNFTALALLHVEWYSQLQNIYSCHHSPAPAFQRGANIPKSSDLPWRSLIKTQKRKKAERENPGNKAEDSPPRFGPSPRNPDVK